MKTSQKAKIRKMVELRRKEIIDVEKERSNKWLKQIQSRKRRVESVDVFIVLQ